MLGGITFQDGRERKICDPYSTVLEADRGKLSVQIELRMKIAFDLQPVKHDARLLLL
jgi:hypothetical protein